MFKNKKQFIQDYKKRIEEGYGRTLQQAHITERYMILGDMVRDYASVHWKETKMHIAQNQQKQMYYFSMEFLIGRLLTNNLMNLGIYDIVKEGLDELGIDINELENLESDAGLGNGGLGRLAACFLDSLASLSLPGHGNCIRYQYGLFKQKILDGYQVEVPDQWMSIANVWEVRKPKHAIDVKFWGHIESHTDENNNLVFEHKDAFVIKAVPYDMPIVGSHTDTVNSLRLWNAEAADCISHKRDFREYISQVNEICSNVYPDDSTEKGKYLRIKQQYFFVCAGIGAIVKAHLRVYGTMDNFHEKVVIQLNDTHPTLAIAELMRILMDEYRYSWQDAWNIVTQTMAYTNHTVLAEALEKWSVHSIQTLLPRIYMIIEEINRRWVNEVNEVVKDHGKSYNMAIIKDGYIHMAHLAIVGSFSVNGVAKLHTDILKTSVMKDFNEYFALKFNNKTNGITHRRWLVYSNPQLKALLKKTIGEKYIKEPILLNKLLKYKEDPCVQEEFNQVKRQRKEILAQYIKKELDIDVDVNSIFDVQAKRLHGYKRQLLNVLHIIYLYQKMKEDDSFRIYPRTFIFAAKAAPSYHFAKMVIKLIHDIAKVINSDEEVNQYLKVVFIPNYNVSVAEILMNAADVSEQISTAGKEASGTGNMKFMMNGALTLGTLDGANVEIHELVTSENDVIFGLTADEVEEKKKTYDAWKVYNKNVRLKKVVDSLMDTTFNENEEEYKVIFDALLYQNDEYLVLEDFASYAKAQAKVERLYLDQSNWAKMMLVNIAMSGFFSSDRTIQQYANEIWNIQKVN